MTRPRRFAVLLTMALGLSGAYSAHAAGQKVLSLLSSGDAESQAFSLILANEVKAAGNTLDLVLCGPAGDIALKAAPAQATKPVTPNGMSVKALLERLIGQGARVELCAIHLPNRALQPDALIAGVLVGKPADVAARLADPSIRVIGR